MGVKTVVGIASAWTFAGALVLASPALAQSNGTAAGSQGASSGTGIAAEPAGGKAPETSKPESQSASQLAEQENPEPPPQHWSFSGPFGTFDRAQLQRGYKVYKEVCSACHSMKRVAFRNLSDPGGPEFTEGQVKALAATFTIKDGPNDAGEMFDRPGRPSDTFPWAYANPQAARAALGALPPDMSVLAKARTYERGIPRFVFDMFTLYQEEGPDYIAALLTGYVDPPPKGFSIASGQFYNAYFPGHRIAMPPPLADNRVEYTDGSPQTVKQYATDVAAFLAWVAEPKMEERKALGFRVLLFLIVLAGLLYYTKRKVWASAHA
jgi:cytochrome c1